jgi:HSP20 family protein
MSLVRREWPDVPEMVRRLFETDVEKGWLRVEEFVDEGALVVRAELPGIDPDKDVEITVSDGVLTIRAERQERTETKEKESYRSEFRYGSFSRTVALPAGASEADVTATYNDGVLEVRVPLGEVPAPEAKKIPVTRG